MYFPVLDFQKSDFPKFGSSQNWIFSKLNSPKLGFSFREMLFKRWIFQNGCFQKCFFFKIGFFKMDFSNFNLLFWLLERKTQKSFRGRSFALPGGTKKKIVFWQCHFEFYIQRYSCTVPFGRTGKIQIAR